MQFTITANKQASYKVNTQTIISLPPLDIWIGLEDLIRQHKEKTKFVIMDLLRLSNRTFHLTGNNSQHTCRSRNPNEETRVLETMKSLLNWVTQRNFDNIKDQLVQTIRGCPSTFTLKSLASFVFDMATVDNAYIVFARLCVNLFHEIPPFPSDESYEEFITFERLFLSKCRMELEKASSVTNRPYVERSISGRFIKTVRLLTEICNNRMVSERTWRSIVQMLKDPIFSIPPEKNLNAMDLFLSFTGNLSANQFSDQNLNTLNRLFNTSDRVLRTPQGKSDDNLCEKLEKTLKELRLSQRETCEERSKRVAADKETQKSVHKVMQLESKYSDEIRIRKETEDALVIKNEEVDALNRLLESYKEELDTLHLQAEALERKHEDELRLRKETEDAVAIEREMTEKVRLQLQILEHEHDLMRANAEEFESKYNSELILRKESELELDKEKTELETMKEVLESCRIEQENIRFEARTWQNRYGEELSLRKETDDGVVKVKEELMMVKGLLISYNEEADAMREERDNALKTVEELKRKQIEERHQTPPSFMICPITQEVMKDPHVTADGFTYEAEAIKRWFNSGRETSPMTNLKLPNRTLVPNRALRSAIEDLTDL